MEMRTWLAIIIIVFFVLIVLDGFRRRWIDRKNQVTVKLDRNVPSGGDDYDYADTAELPGGGVVRVTSRDDDENNSVREEVQGSDNNFDNILLNERIEPSFSSVEDFSELNIGDDFQENEKTSFNPKSKVNPSTKKPKVKATAFDQPDFLEGGVTVQSKPKSKKTEVIVINVMARNQKLFSGQQLLPVLLQLGMRLGDMSIFHRHGDMNGDGPVMFSMMNMIEPGTFDMGSMDELMTPGISLFLQLPAPAPLNNMQCFEKMLESANTIKAKLNGDIKDENHSVITYQTNEHSRQRIRDFELEQLSKK